MASSTSPREETHVVDDEDAMLEDDTAQVVSLQGGRELYRTFRFKTDGNFGKLEDFAHNTMRMFFDNTMQILSTTTPALGLRSDLAAYIEMGMSDLDRQTFHRVPLRMLKIFAQCLQYRPFSRLVAKQLLNAVFVPSRNKQLSIRDFVITHLKKEKGSKRRQGRTESRLRT